MKGLNSFFSAVGGTDPLYEWVKNEREYSWLKTDIERMWSRYHPICPDPQFSRKAADDLVAMCWQMQFSVLLLDNGFDLSRPPRDAPDICLTHNGQLYWIETVAPGPGDRADAVPSDLNGDEFPEKEIILRFTSALEAKRNQYKSWLEKKTISATEHFIVAINGGKIPSAGFDGGISCLAGR